MSKILITGGAGFIGSNFIYYCLEKNCKILNFDALTYAGNLNNLKNIKNNDSYTFVKGDICNKELLDDYLDSFNPDYIVNFAAESHVDRSVDNPYNFIKTNIIGTYHLLSSSLKYYLNKDDKSEFKFLHISTDEVFGSLKDSGHFDENTRYNPSSPYSATKASSDHLVNAWSKTYNLPVIISNCSNNYGPYQFPEKLIPLIIQRCLQEKMLPIYGDGKNIRDWIYVKDHCDALYKILDKGSTGERYVIGGNEEKTNLEVVQIICKVLDTVKPSTKLNSYTDLIKFVNDRPGHDYRYAINSSKINKDLNWCPKVDFKKGIIKTINWYIENEIWVENIIDTKYKLSRMGI